MVMAHGCFFLFLIFFSSFISTNSILHAYASNPAQRNSLGLSSPPSSNRISINYRPGRKGITKCNHNDLAALTVVSDSDRPTKGTPGGRRSLGGGTPVNGIIAGVGYPPGAGYPPGGAGFPGGAGYPPRGAGYPPGAAGAGYP